MAGLLDDRILRTVPVVEGFKVLYPVVLHRKLGEGAMGAVYAGRHLNLGVNVAVKCLIEDAFKDTAEAVARFRKEARTAAQVRSPHLVGVYDVLHRAGLHYIVMEYVEGQTAEDMVDRGAPLDPRTALTVIRDAAQGLAAAHAAGIVHRDIKPANMLVSWDGRVKILDLGIAKTTSGSGQSMQTMANSLMGTPGYMPMELFDGAVNAVPASDVYALGLTLGFLVHGSHLVRGPSLSAVMKIHFDGIPRLTELLAGKPPKLVELVRRSAARDPADRPRDAAAFMAQVEALLGTMGGPVSLAREPVLDSAARGIREPTRDDLERINDSLMSSTDDPPERAGGSSSQVEIAFPGTVVSKTGADFGKTVLETETEFPATVVHGAEKTARATAPAAPPPAREPPPRAEPPPAARPATPPPRGGSKAPLVAAIAVLVVAIAAVALWPTGRDAEKGDDTAQAPVDVVPPAVDPTPPVEPPTEPPNPPVEDPPPDKPLPAIPVKEPGPGSNTPVGAASGDPDANPTEPTEKDAPPKEPESPPPVPPVIERPPPPPPPKITAVDRAREHVLAGDWDAVVADLEGIVEEGRADPERVEALLRELRRRRVERIETPDSEMFADLARMPAAVRGLAKAGSGEAAMILAESLLWYDETDIFRSRDYDTLAAYLGMAVDAGMDEAQFLVGELNLFRPIVEQRGPTVQEAQAAVTAYRASIETTKNPDAKARVAMWCLQAVHFDSYDNQPGPEGLRGEDLASWAWKQVLESTLEQSARGYMTKAKFASIGWLGGRKAQPDTAAFRAAVERSAELGGREAIAELRKRRVKGGEDGAWAQGVLESKGIAFE